MIMVIVIEEERSQEHKSFY